MENSYLKTLEEANLKKYKAKTLLPKILTIVPTIPFIMSILSGLIYDFMSFSDLVWPLGWSAVGLFWWSSVRFNYKRGIHNYNDYNATNNGIYIHKFLDGKDRYEIEINTHNETVRLVSGQNEKTYPFSQIEGVKSVCGESTFGYHLTATGGMAGATQNLANMSLAQGLGLKANWKQNGLFIYVDDLQFPMWQIKFYAENFIKYTSDKFWSDVAMQYERWLKVFEKTLNMK
ncbi:DUF4755 domain-containing protein [Lonepinella sp. BR2271]|uniref:DUF4755 domain-containing protein n=1 Tax=Lonepinella sp. BR2271 TaxID=3434550 RepID=UPI003F6DC000